MIRVKQKGDFGKLTTYLVNVNKAIKPQLFTKYAEAGVAALQETTPKDMGLTSQSWIYKINTTSKKTVIEFWNTNIQNGVPVAIVLFYGHTTRNGAWIEGVDYINPALVPVFKGLADEAWKEVVKS